MSERLEINTFFTPDAPGTVFINEEELRSLIDIVEAHGFQITWNNDLHPHHEE